MRIFKTYGITRYSRRACPSPKINNSLKNFQIFSLVRFRRGWRRESLGFWNCSFICPKLYQNATFHDAGMIISTLHVFLWLPRLSFSCPYLRIYLYYIIEIQYSLQDRLHNLMCIISALYLKWVLSCRGGVKSDSILFNVVQVFILPPYR